MSDSSADDTPDTSTPSSGVKPKTCSCEPSHQVRFSFGPDAQYYFHTNITYIASVKPGSWREATNAYYHAVAFTADGGIFQALSSVPSTSDSDESRWIYSGPVGPTSAIELAYWKLYQKIGWRDVVVFHPKSQINLTLGPRGSYFTTTRDGPLYRNIPKDLEDKIKASDRAPVHVALGYDQTWICLWQDHTFSWNLKDKYQDLAAKLQKCRQTEDTVALVALSPYEDTGAWFMVDCDGGIQYALKNIKLTSDVSEGIHQQTLEYMQRHVRKTGITITNKYTRGSDNKVIITEIGPKTQVDAPAVFGVKRLAPLSQRIQEAKLYIPQRLRQPDFRVAGSVALSTAVVCKVSGLKTRPALNAGVIAGTVAVVLFQRFGT